MSACLTTARSFFPQGKILHGEQILLCASTAHFALMQVYLARMKTARSAKAVNYYVIYYLIIYRSACTRGTKTGRPAPWAQKACRYWKLWRKEWHSAGVVHHHNKVRLLFLLLQSFDSIIKLLSLRLSVGIDRDQCGRSQQTSSCLLCLSARV